MRCITPGAPMIVPKCLSGDGTVALSCSSDHDCGRNFGSLVYSRIRRVYSVSILVCAKETAGQSSEIVAIARDRRVITRFLFKCRVRLV